MPCRWNRVGLLNLPSPGISAAALCAGPGHWGMKGILFLTAPILPTFVASFRSLYQDADGTMQCFVWHKDQKAVCPMLAEWTSEILSLSLPSYTACDYVVGSASIQSGVICNFQAKPAAVLSTRAASAVKAVSIERGRVSSNLMSMMS